jgi:septum formation protein
VVARAGIPAAGAVLGADTEVVVGERVLGKPADLAEAREMLGLLAGREHDVRSALALVTEEGEWTAQEHTRVRFRVLEPAEIDWYLGRGEWPERAGAYAIQGAGAALVARIEGDYTTVVGLPLASLIELLRRSGLAPWWRWSTG